MLGPARPCTFSISKVSFEPSFLKYAFIMWSDFLWGQKGFVSIKSVIFCLDNPGPHKRRKEVYSPSLSDDSLCHLSSMTQREPINYTSERGTNDSHKYSWITNDPNSASAAPAFSHSLALPTCSSTPPAWHHGLRLLRRYVEMLLLFSNALFPRGKASVCLPSAANHSFLMNENFLKSCAFLCLGLE